MSVRANAIRELANSFSRIHRLPHIEIINLTFYPIHDNRVPIYSNPLSVFDNRVDFDDGSRLAVQASILEALAASCKVRVPSKLLSLELHNLHTSDLSSLETAQFQKFLTCLRRLQLTVLQPTSYGRKYNFWSTFSPIILNPTQQFLTELILHSSVCIWPSSGFSLTGLHFPHLTALSVRNLIFVPSVGVEPFILRHASTLARLELLACKPPAYRELPPFEWSPPSSDYCWDTIWDRFAMELTALVTLNVDELDCPYVGFFYRFNLSDEAIKSHNAADDAALQRFHVVVTARSEEMRETLRG